MLRTKEHRNKAENLTQRKKKYAEHIEKPPKLMKLLLFQ